MERVTTVVTCMTDAERPYLLDALTSVQRQTEPTRTILCIEDHNDWAEQVVTGLAAVDILRLSLAPSGEVRNQALAHVETEFVAFLDGDDSWHPHKLSLQLKAVERKGLDVIATRHLLVREDGTPYFFGFAKDVPMPSSWLGRTTVFLERPFADVRIAEDVLLWRQLQQETRWDVLGRFLIRYRVREGSLSSMTWSKKRKLAYAHLSERTGMRPLLLAGSYAANLALSAQSAMRRRSAR